MVHLHTFCTLCRHWLSRTLLHEYLLNGQFNALLCIQLNRQTHIHTCASVFSNVMQINCILHPYPIWERLGEFCWLGCCMLLTDVHIIQPCGKYEHNIVLMLLWTCNFCNLIFELYWNMTPGIKLHLRNNIHWNRNHGEWIFMIASFNTQ